MTNQYIGRFAPSPTGPLHAGSLVSALGSWADAKRHGGKWLIRIEDIDPQRETPEAATRIITSLEAHHLFADENITYQHDNSHHYDKALNELRAQNKLYACTCTRKSLRALHQSNYPGTCRNLRHTEEDRSLRVLIDAADISFKDITHGDVTENVSQSVGDFIVRRRGPFYAYQLAVVVDDARQNITHVVRGSDLLDNTARQIVLQRLLHYPQPEYLHLPLAIGNDGRKLSKQTGAQPLDDNDAVSNLRAAWRLLGQIDPPEYISSCKQFLAHCKDSWDRELIPKVSA